MFGTIGSLGLVQGQLDKKFGQTIRQTEALPGTEPVQNEAKAIFSASGAKVVKEYLSNEEFEVWRQFNQSGVGILTNEMNRFSQVMIERNIEQTPGR